MRTSIKEERVLNDARMGFVGRDDWEGLVEYETTHDLEPLTMAEINQLKDAQDKREQISILERRLMEKGRYQQRRWEAAEREGLTP